jgi:hypothetical protein
MPVSAGRRTMRAMDTAKSLLACGIATALALSQSNDEQQLACAVGPVTALSAAAECHEKQAPPLHMEPSDNGPPTYQPTLGITVQPIAFQFVVQPAAFAQPMRGNLIVTDPTSYAPRD